jgi:hypothetical protein
MNTKFSKSIKKKFLVTTIVLVGIFIGGFYQKSESASLTNVSVTLSNSRLSFSGVLAAGNTAGNSQVTIVTTPNAWPSTSSAQLVSGFTSGVDETVGIGEAGSIGTYTISSIDSESTFSVSPVLAAGDADSGDIVISTQSATQTVRFTTANAITDGSFRVLVPANADSATSQDGLPDSGNFDYSNSTPTVTCPANTTGYTFGSGTAAASSVTIGSQDYHAFECPYTGAGAIGTVFSDGIIIDDLINPSPKIGHTTGLADTYRIIVQHLNSVDAVIDSTTTSVGIIEAVRITATVTPQITFQISGIASGTTACNVSTDVSTTAAAVPLGELTISAFTDAAQSLSVSTNATGGYASYSQSQ